jgi:hypothetical protein
MNVKPIVTLFFFILSVSVFGQQDSQNNSNYYSSSNDDNELRVNLLMSILGLPEVNYERYISENMGVGVAVAISVEKIKDMSLRNMVLPYYRIYFGDKKASGFFIEGNMALANQKEYTYAYAYDPNGNYVENRTGNKSSTNFGFGAAIGFKLLARSDVSGELYLGAGRFFGNSIDAAYPRVGICIGKRF